MYAVAAVIRDYNAAADTATVELLGIGAIDAWLDGIKLNVGVRRHYVVAGMRCVVQMLDIHQICNATIVSLDATPGAGSGTWNAPPSGSFRVLTGRLALTTDNTGAGSSAVTFPSAFTAAPAVFALSDDGTHVSLSGISATGFTAGLSGATHNSTVHITWGAEGV